MKKFLCLVVTATFFIGSVAQADLNTVTHIDSTAEADSIGDIVGDITGQGPVSVRDLPGNSNGDLWNNGDTFTFLHDSERVTGDFTATVRVTGQTAAVDGRWGKGGVMMRHNLEGNASNAVMGPYTGNGSQLDPPTADSAVTDHSPVDVRVNGRLVNGENGGGFERPILRDGGSFRNNFVPATAPGAMDGEVNPVWTRIQFNSATNTIVAGYADDVDGAPGDWAYTDPFSDVDVPEDGWYVGLAYSAHNSMVADDLFTDDNPDGLHGMTFEQYSIVPEFLLPELKVAGGDIGGLNLTGALSNTTLGPDMIEQGLTTYFYDRPMRNNITGDDGFLAATGRGESGVVDGGVFGPVVNPFGHWTGSGDPLTIGGVELPKYPEGTFTDADRNNYGAVAKGQVFVAANGEYSIVDGIDDFTMLAIDLDGDGELQGVADLTNDTRVVGEYVGFDEVLLIDDDWAGKNGGGGNGNGNNLAFGEFSNIEGDGEWREFELWMAEGGGGDAGIIYMGPSDDFDPDLPLTAEEQDDYLIQPDQFRTITNEVTAGDSEAALRTDVDYILQVGAGGSDQIAVDDRDGVLNTTLDVAGATVTIDDMGDLAAGTEVKIFDADSVTGTDSLTLNVPAGFDTSRIAEGILVFGEGNPCDPNTLGDLDGNGQVEFADFLTLSANFGNAATSHTEGDIDCSGDVGFSDFLTLSANFGTSVGEAESVPEPTSFLLFGLAGLMGGLFRRRRN